jgi:hypothetical protein
VDERFSSANSIVYRNLFVGQKGLRKPKKYSAEKEIRALARERVGTVPSPKIMVPKNLRKKPKHKKPIEAEEA